MKLRVVLDLDKTLIGNRLEPGGAITVQPRPGVLDFLRALKDRGHTLVLWTGATQPWVERLSAAYPEVFLFLDETYTRETRPPVEYRRGRYRIFKDIRRVRGDVLIDDEARFKRIADREGMGERYIWIPAYEPGMHDRSRMWLGRVLRYVDYLSEAQRASA